MNAIPGEQFEDKLLRRLARGTIDWPVETHELSGHEILMLRIKLSLIGAAVLIVIFFAGMVALGFVPSLYDGVLTNLSEVDSDVFWVMLGAVPAGAALLIFLLTWFMGGTSSDQGGHPWRFRATETSFEIATSDGAVHTGTWDRWRVVHHTYFTYRNMPVSLTSLTMTLDGGRTLTMNIVRVRKRTAQLLRAILQKARPD